MILFNSNAKFSKTTNHKAYKETGKFGELKGEKYKLLLKKISYTSYTRQRL